MHCSVGGIDHGEGHDMWEVFVLLAQLCYEPKTSLKYCFKK
jgi:hypothetical protein